MNKEDKDILEAKVKETYGSPEWDFDQTPLNESAKKIKEIRTQFRMENLKRSRDVAKLAGKKLRNEDLKEIAENIPEDKLKPFRTFSYPVYIAPNDMVAFSDVEKDIIIAYFEDFKQSHSSLANRFGVARQTVTALINSPSFKVLYTKVFDKILPLKAMIAIHDLVESKDPKVTLEVARNYNLIKNESLDVTSKVKPIEDPEMIRYLKELGDKAVGENGQA